MLAYLPTTAGIKRKQIVIEDTIGDLQICSLAEQAGVFYRDIYALVGGVLFWVAQIAHLPSVRARIGGAAAFVQRMRESFLDGAEDHFQARFVEAWDALGLPRDEYARRKEIWSAVDAVKKQRRAQERADKDARDAYARAEKDRAEQAALSEAAISFAAGVRISGESFLALCRARGVKIPPRTAGLFKHVVGIDNGGGISLSKKVALGGISAVFHQLKATL